MPSVRYYDYGVMRREADMRMLDAQRRSTEQHQTPMRRVTPDFGAQTRPAEGSLPIRVQDAPMCGECNDGEAAGELHCRCNAGCERNSAAVHAVQHGEKPTTAAQGEELLIAVLLLLAINEGSGLPLILTLLYLLL